MAMFAYTVARGIPATSDQGRECKIAIALVRHENGYMDRVAIDEEFLRYASGGNSERETEVIENEIKLALDR